MFWFPVQCPFWLWPWIQWVSWLHAIFGSILVLSFFTWRLQQVRKGEVVNPVKDTVATMGRKGVWLINGKRYDLTDFLDRHPGGAFALQICEGSDCTGLFETYHTFVDPEKQMAIMKKYELPDDSTRGKDIQPLTVGETGQFNCAFHKDVKEMCREHFAGKGKNAHKCKTSHFVWHIFVQAMLFYSLYRVYFYEEWFSCIIVSLCASHLTFNVAHEASHFTYSSSKLFNRIMSMAGIPFSFNSVCWHLQHVVQHHIHTNLEHDVDLYHFIPLMRVSAIFDHKTAFILQPILFFLVLLPTAITHLYFVVPVDILWGTTDPAIGEKRYEQATHLEVFRRNTFWQMLAEALTFPGYLAVVLWFKGGGFLELFPLWCFITSLCSIQFLFCTQVTHLQKGAQDAKKLADPSWAKRQVYSAFDYNQDSYGWMMYTGGLNMQVIHHVLPCVSASHYCDMYPKFREVCKRHNVEILEYPSAWSTARGFYAWICELAHASA
eukprot:TRINITY_DN102618_c0_g1_i1.p1 TRINITY_DN102618_c0_g1~~TRINITY_DN102618_c0_g1_i1.p1  ORF type:complete len:492 (-),score=86.76 TRINITY_DN102618_c0_g1_i1:120-1595(-)